MASIIDICNSALNLLGASTISSLTEDTKNARLCNQRYEPIRNRVFRSHNWNCLIKRGELGRNSSAPVCEYAYSYALPSDFLRVLKIFNGTTDSIEADLPYKIESKDLITDQTTVYLVYIALDVDPTNYDAYLYEALATSIAADLTYPITNNASLVTKYRDLADERLREARFIDATENSVSTVESGEFVDARL